MPNRRPVSPETRAQVVELARSGVGRNEIARRLKVSAGTVTAIAQEAEISFDWRSTELATRARQIELGAMRSELAKVAMLRAFEALDAMSAPHVIVNFSPATEDRKASYHEHVLDIPTASDQRNYATIFGILSQRSTELMRSADGGGMSSEAASVLGGLGDALNMVAAAMQADPSTDPTAEPTSITREEMIADLEARIDAAGGEEEAPDEEP